ncbi:MAG: hypothetical protein WC712_05795 [Candidatus Brocadiia bacterium]
MAILRNRIRAAIFSYIILAAIVAIVSYFTWFCKPLKAIPPPPSGYLTEPPIVTDRTRRPAWKTEYPTAAIRTVTESGPTAGGGK